MQALRQRFTVAETAPFLIPAQYAVLRWGGERGAYGLQATVLDEIADATPDFERCRAVILEVDPRVERVSAGREQEARQEIVAFFEWEELAAEWQRHNAVSPEERAKLHDVEERVRALLASQEWQAEEAKWRAYLPVP